MKKSKRLKPSVMHKLGGEKIQITEREQRAWGYWVNPRCTVKVDCSECHADGECNGEHNGPNSHSYYCDICGFVTVEITDPEGNPRA